MHYSRLSAIRLETITSQSKPSFKVFQINIKWLIATSIESKLRILINSVSNNS